jgi:hypothetical protein
VCLDLSIPEQAVVAVEGRAGAEDANRRSAVVWKEVGRLAVVGVPRRVDARELREVDSELNDMTLIIYTRLTHSGRVAIDRARYGGPVSFELSDFEVGAAEILASA